jgi:hypothetical protein
MVIPSFFRFVWPPDAPPGPYIFFIAVTVPDALADARLDAGEILVIAVRPVTFAPP